MSGVPLTLRTILEAVVIAFIVFALIVVSSVQ